MSAELERARAALAAALGPERLAGVDPDEPLLGAGVLSSIELVTVVATLEARTGLRIAPGALASGELGTLRGLAATLAGRRPAAMARGGPYGPAWRSLRRVCQRPLRALLLLLACLILLDRGVGWALRGPLQDRVDAFWERGQRLYPGLGDLSHDHLAAAVRRHAVSRPAPEGTAVRILVLGDSGTVGSYVGADEAWPARAEAHLRARGVQVQVLNLGFYGRLLAKDLMLLEAAWEDPFDLVVFTVSDDAVSRGLNAHWSGYRHTSVNWPLLARFAARVPVAEQPPFQRALAALQAADRARWGALRRAWLEWAELPCAAPFLAHALADQALPEGAPSSFRWTRLVPARVRWGLNPAHASRLRVAIPRDDVDGDAEALLRSTVRLLAARGVRAALVFEPVGPRAWARPAPSGQVSRRGALRNMIEAEGGAFADAAWALEGPDFLDDFAHYTPAGHDRVGALVAQALAPLVEQVRR